MYSNVLQLTTVNTVTPRLYWENTDSSNILSRNAVWKSTMPILSTNCKWLSSGDGLSWYDTLFTGNTLNVFGCDNIYMQYACIVSTSIKELTAVSPTLFTSNVTRRSTCMLLLKGEGLNGSDNSSYTDSSVNNLTVARYGAVTQGSYTPYTSDGLAYNYSTHGGSGFFDGGSYLTVPKGAAYTINAQVNRYWTIEGWFNSANLSVTNGCYSVSDYLQLSFSSTAIAFVYGIYAPIVSIVKSMSFTTNTWYHIAVSCNDGVITLYVNGNSVGSVTTNPQSNSSGQVTSAFYIGANDTYPYGGSLDQPFIGYISNFRITNTAIYTTDFAPPTSPVTLTSNGEAVPSTAPTINDVTLLLNFTNGGIIDSRYRGDIIADTVVVDSSVKKYGSGSLYFSAYTSQLRPAVNSVLAPGDSSFTIECWYRLVSVSSMGVGIIFSYAISGNNNLLLALDSSRSIGLWAGNTNLGQTASGAIPLNTWCHVALVRNGSVYNIYIDGVSVHTATNSSSIGVDMAPCINGYAHDNRYGNICYMDDFQITKAALYTSNFATPGSLTYP